MTLDMLKGTSNGKNLHSTDGKEENWSAKTQRKKTYHSDWYTGYQQRQFQSEHEALKYLAHYLIRPTDQAFVLVAECQVGRERHDALDYLMYNHNYKVIYV